MTVLLIAFFAIAVVAMGVVLADSGMRLWSANSSLTARRAAVADVRDIPTRRGRHSKQMAAAIKVVRPASRAAQSLRAAA